MNDRWHGTKEIEDRLKEIKSVSERVMILEERLRQVELYIEREENRKKDAINLLKIE